MIRLIDLNGTEHPLSDYTDYHITHMLDGCDTMTFCVPTSHEQYQLLREEAIIRTDQNEYLIKKIDDDKIDCELNFDFLKTRVYANYCSSTRTLQTVLADHLPSGWTVEGASVSTISRTIEFDACTDYDVVYACIDTYSVKFVWHILEKRLVVVKPELMPSTGEYITSELNLESLSFKGESTSFATRLYAYGKDGMTLESAVVDGATYGKTYVENTAYASKVVCATWTDERYTIPEHLYEAAVEKLSEMAYPVRSYSCKVRDLAKADSRYSFLTFTMHRKLSLIDVERGITVEHQIVEYDEWPDEETENTVTLSSVQSTIYDSIAAEKENLEEKLDIAEKENGTISEELSNRLNLATAMMTSAFGSHFYTSNGELFMMDTEDPTTAEVVWRWNVNGFAKSSTGIDGPYTTALTMDDTFFTGLIEAITIRGDLIEANTVSAEKIQQTYTDDVLSQAFTAAKGYVEALFSDLDTYLQGTDTVTVMEQDIADIKATIDGISFDFSQSFRGGINYVSNSSGLNGLSDDWTYTGTVVTLQSSGTKNSTVSNSCFRLSADAELSQEIDNVVAGRSYTVSCMIKKDNSLLSEVEVVYNGETVGTLFSSSSAISWVECTFTINDIQSNTLKVVCRTRSDYLYVADIMVNEGTTSKAWTPAPDEIYTSGVKIDKTGIEVYRSDSDEKTVINNQEFAGYYQDEEVFSLNKDETRINKAVVRGQLRIEDVMFIPYENGDDKGLNITIVD